MNRRVLITGGAGFIGFHLARSLLADGCHVHLCDDLSRGVIDRDLKNLLSDGNISISQVDLLNRDSVLALGDSFEIIFHLAAIVGVQNVVKRPYDVLVANTSMLKNIISLAHQQKYLSRLLFSSTSEVYAGTLEHFGLSIPTSETTAITISSLKEPRATYMISKIMGEAMCQQADVPFTIFRPHNIYGPRMGMAHVIPEQLKKAFDATAGDCLGVRSPNHTRTFCYIDDAIQLLRRMIEVSDCVGQTLNLGAETPELTIQELVLECIAVTGKNLTIEPLEPTKGSPERRAPDMGLTK